MKSERLERVQCELCRVQAECDRYRIESETQKEEADRFAARIGKYQDQQERNKEDQQTCC